MNDISQSKKALNPFLKWAGGKRWLMQAVPEIFPVKFNRYIEPFLGGGAVFFNMLPENALLGDINHELILTYQAIRDMPNEVVSALRRHGRLHSDNYYYEVRSSKKRSAVERAARFIYLNRTCWNGLYRVNKLGEFNVPRGTKDAILLATDNFSEISKALKSVELRASDFAEVLEEAEGGDFVFVDPPYTVSHNTNGFIKYNDKIFAWADQIRLRDCVENARTRGVKILVLNAAHESIEDLYKDFPRQLHLARHSVLASDSGNRRLTEELAVLSWND